MSFDYCSNHPTNTLTLALICTLNKLQELGYTPIEIAEYITEWYTVDEVMFCKHNTGNAGDSVCVALSLV